MESMKKVFEEAITHMKFVDHEEYEELESELYEIVEGKRISEDIAKEWVESMNPKAIWTMEDTTTVKTKYNVDIPEVEFYVLMNMMQSDYMDIVAGEVDKAVKMSMDWYFDEDFGKDGSEKLYCYWKIRRA